MSQVYIFKYESMYVTSLYFHECMYDLLPVYILCMHECMTSPHHLDVYSQGQMFGIVHDGGFLLMSHNASNPISPLKLQKK